MNDPCWAVVPAAGVGRRMGCDVPKQYLQIAGRTVLEYSLDTLVHHPLVKGVTVAVSADDPYWPQSRFSSHPSVSVCPGGAERFNSVLNALGSLRETADPQDWVLVHDAARPCLPATDIEMLVQTVQQHGGGGILAVPVADTLKQVDTDKQITATIDRSALWRALTPQMFRLGELHDVLQSALARGHIVTDESSAMELAGFRPLVVHGSAANIKITHPEDLRIAELCLKGG